MEAEFDVLFPSLRLEGAYKSEGRIDGLKFNSKGDMNMTMCKLAL